MNVGAVVAGRNFFAEAIQQHRHEVKGATSDACAVPIIVPNIVVSGFKVCLVLVDALKMHAQKRGSNLLCWAHALQIFNSLMTVWSHVAWTAPFDFSRSQRPSSFLFTDSRVELISRGFDKSIQQSVWSL